MEDHLLDRGRAWRAPSHLFGRGGRQRAAVVAWAALGFSALAIPGAGFAQAPSARQSARAYRNQSDGQALVTARQRFPWFLNAPPLRWPAADVEAQLKGYLSDRAAIVGRLPGRRGLVESSVPLRGETPDGRDAAIDLGLVDAGSSSFAPKSAAAAVRIPARSDGALRFLDRSFGLRLEGARRREAMISQNKAFFANVAEDSDLVLEPRPQGAELSVILRSPAAPTEIPLGLDLASGQRLQLTDGSGADPLPAGSVEVVEGTERVAAIYPATAADADGTAVPVSYHLDGDRLVMEVSLSADTVFPVLVDPTIGVYDNNGNSTGPGTPGYTWPNWAPATYLEQANTTSTSWSYCNNQASNPSKQFYFCQGSTSGSAGAGGPLYIKPNAGQNFALGNWAQWVRRARPDDPNDPNGPSYAYIYRLDAAALSNVGAHQAHLVVGVRKADASDWETGDALGSNNATAPNNDLGPGLAAYKTPRDTALVGDTRYLRVRGAQATPSAPSPPITPGNRAMLRIVMETGLPGTPLPYVAMGGAATYSSELYAPTLDPPTHSMAPDPLHWVQGYTDTVSTTARDKGLGMGTISLSQPGIPTTTVATGCLPNGGPTGTRNSYDGCPLALAMPGKTYTAPEGIDTYNVSAQDLVGNSVIQDQTWQVKVDHSGPDLTVTGLTDNQTVSQDTSLTLQATDGDRSSPATERAGVKNLDMTVRNSLGTSVQASPDPSPQSCTSSCPKSRSLALTPNALPSGQYTVELSATDQVGNSTLRRTPITVIHPPVNAALPAVRGVARDGEVLTTSAGSWTSPTPVTYSYQWQSCAATDGKCSDLSGETEPTITLRSEDVAQAIRVIVIARNTDASVSAASAATISVVPLPPMNSHEPGIRGEPYAGSPLDVDVGTWEGSFPFAYQYQWYRCLLPGLCNAIPGATSSAYSPTFDDLSYALHADVTAANGAGAATVSSAESDSIEPAASAPNPDGGPGEPDPLPDTQLDREQASRAEMGLRSDGPYVQALIADPSLGFSRDNYGASLTALDERAIEAGATVQDAIGNIDDYGTSQAAADYAGVYSDSVDGASVIHVGFTRSASQHLADINGFFPYPSRVRTFSADRTLKELTTLQARVETDWDALVATGTRVTSVTIDVEANQVAVGVSNPSSAIAADFVTRYGPGVTMVDEQPAVDAVAPSGPTKRTSRTRPMRAGLAIYPADHSAVCTAGYLTKDEVPRPIIGDVQDVYGMMTAGHCFRDQDTHIDECGQQWRQGGRSIGCQYGDNTYKNGTRSDAGMILLNTSKDSSNLLYLSNKFSRYVRSVYQHDQKGYSVCLSGYRSGVACGHILRSGTYSIASSHGTRRIKSIVRVSGFECGPGDSGAPIYHFAGAEDAQAVGIVSAFIPRYAGAHFGPCLYSQVRHVQQELNVTVRTHR